MAEQDTHCQSKEKIVKMAIELKDVADRYQLLEKESRAKAADLEKAMVVAREPPPKSERRAKFGDPNYAPLDQLWSAADAYLDLAKSAADAKSAAERS